MQIRRARSTVALLLVQGCLVVGGLMTLVFYPPANGAMALIALDGRDAGRLAQAALADGATLLGRGPLPNILVVQGARDRIARDMLAAGVLVIAAPRSWCGPAGGGQ